MAKDPPTSDTTSATTTLTILCFGDSLTEGYSQWGNKMTPYGTTTLEFLSSQLPSSTEVQLCVEGRSGDLVTQGFLPRMETLYEGLNENDTKWNWVVFLGGTNDLGYGRNVDDIWTFILAVTSIPMVRDGAKLLLCTVPECAAKSSRLDAKREELNEKIRGDDREGVYVLDLHKKMPYHALTTEEREEIWDDGLHFTEEGYERIGAFVGRRLVGILERGEGRADVD